MNLSGLLSALGNQIGGAEIIREQNRPLEAALVQSGFDITPERRSDNTLGKITQGMFGGTSNPARRAVMSDRHPSAIAALDRQMRQNQFDRRMDQDQKNSDRTYALEKERFNELVDQRRFENEYRSKAEENRYNEAMKKIRAEQAKEERNATNRAAELAIEFRKLENEIINAQLEKVTDSTELESLFEKLYELKNKRQELIESPFLANLFNFDENVLPALQGKQDYGVFTDPNLVKEIDLLDTTILNIEDRIRGFGKTPYLTRNIPIGSSNYSNNPIDKEIGETLDGARDSLTQAAQASTMPDSSTAGDVTSGLFDRINSERMYNPLPFMSSSSDRSSSAKPDSSMGQRANPSSSEESTFGRVNTKGLKEAFPFLSYFGDQALLAKYIESTGDTSPTSPEKLARAKAWAASKGMTQ